MKWWILTWKGAEPTEPNFKSWESKATQCQTFPGNRLPYKKGIITTIAFFVPHSLGVGVRFGIGWGGCWGVPLGIPMNQTPNLKPPILWKPRLPPQTDWYAQLRNTISTACRASLLQLEAEACWVTLTLEGFLLRLFYHNHLSNEKTSVSFRGRKRIILPTYMGIISIIKTL